MERTVRGISHNVRKEIDDHISPFAADRAHKQGPAVALDAVETREPLRDGCLTSQGRSTWLQISVAIWQRPRQPLSG